MAFIVEDGTGKSDANSFADIGEFRDYWNDRGTNLPQVSWTDARTQQNLVKATSYLNANYRDRFKGIKNTYTQALQWPRFNAIIDGTGDVLFVEGLGTTMNGYVVPNNVVPTEVKQAVFELAVVADTEELSPNLEVGDGFVKSEKVGPIEVQYQKGYSPVPIWRWADSILSPLLESSGINVTIMRS